MRIRLIAIATLMLLAETLPARAQMIVQREGTDDGFGYAKAGGGLLFGDQVYALPGITLIGFRAGFGSFGVDTSLLSLLGPAESGGPTGSAAYASAVTGVKVQLLHFHSPDSDRTLYSGLGLGLYGERQFGSGKARGGPWDGQGWQGELSAGYEFGRSTMVRPFLQLDLTLPFYLSLSEIGLPARRAPSMAMSVGLGFQHLPR
jgi:hypothetical protein